MQTRFLTYKKVKAQLKDILLSTKTMVQEAKEQFKNLQDRRGKKQQDIFEAVDKHLKGEQNEPKQQALNYELVNQKLYAFFIQIIEMEEKAKAYDNYPLAQVYIIK